MNNLERYLQLMDQLRLSRQARGWTAAQDRPMLAELEDLYGKLSDVDQARVEAESGRAWPPERSAQIPDA